ncbi:hypothetical protein HKCCE2091_07475 [Rhodobacterales bacterium HKCCE2091]|nr:hypothetical protein [Rhodobacterales bacterium HKCCE2091]
MGFLGTIGTALLVGLGVGVAMLLFIGGPVWGEDLADRWDQWRRDRADMRDPPWVSPRLLHDSRNRAAYQAMLKRLTLVEDRSAEHYDGFSQYLRDAETGQLWHHYFHEPNMSQMYYLAPVDGIPPRRNA